MKYKLPKFPPNLISTFKRLCEPLPLDALPQLRDELIASAEKARKAAASNPVTNKKRLEQLIEKCSVLLDFYPQCPEDKRGLIIGALRYFVIDEDELPDEVFFTGFDDDARIVNHVLEQVGIEGQFIELE